MRRISLVIFLCCKVQLPIWNILLLMLQDLASYQVSSGINTQKDEKQDGKAPERTTSITEEWKRNTDYRRQSQHHSHINK